ncbi:MAG: CBASS cGAMP-activated phospholipase [Aestuariibacter sp.]
MLSELVKILSLTGGGYRGLYTAEVIRNIEHYFKSEVKNHCDCIAGTSIGGIIALGLASGKTSDEIIKAFKFNKDRIFAPKSWYHTWYYSSKYHNSGLKNTIKSILGDFAEKTMQDLKEYSGIDLLITTVEMDTGKTLLINTIDDEFKQWKLIDVALATSAAPTFFPAHTRNKIRYIDGGVSCNMPDILVAQKYSQMRGVTIDDLNILSIGTCYLSENHCPATNIDADAGAARWALNLEYFINVQTPLVHKQCEAMFKSHRYARIDSELEFELKLDNITKAAEDLLIEKAKVAVSKRNILGKTALLQFMQNP